MSIRVLEGHMDVIGGRKFVDVPGGKTQELPPLLIHDPPP